MVDSVGEKARDSALTTGADPLASLLGQAWALWGVHRSWLLYNTESPPCIIHLIFTDHRFSAATTGAAVHKTSKQSAHGPCILGARNLMG